MGDTIKKIKDSAGTEYELEASKLSTARTIALSGDVSGSVSFDGSKNVTITATVADDSHNHIISNIDGLQTALNGMAASNHTHSAYVNQNAFSNVVVGSTTIAADSATDTLTLVAGNNITLTPDATNDKVTIANSYTLPKATSSVLGGVKPVAKTDAMTQEVGVDSTGALYTASSNPITYTTTMPTANAGSPGLVYLMDA